MKTELKDWQIVIIAVVVSLITSVGILFICDQILPDTPIPTENTSVDYVTVAVSGNNVWVDDTQVWPQWEYLLQPELDQSWRIIESQNATIDYLLEHPIEKIVTQNVTVLKTVYCNISVKRWESVEQFEEWYGTQGFRLLFPSGVYKVDCDDYSRRAQETALEQGLPISEAIAKDGYYCGVRVTDFRGYHAGCLVRIGNIYYWFEPQEKEVQLVEIINAD